MRITLAKIGNDKTVAFAASELRKYLKMIDEDLFVDVCSYDLFDKSVEDVIWVGQDESFDLPHVEDSRLDDGILIDIAKNSGVISGTNPRSVLIAVYRFLKELGCAWVRASCDGEIIPSYTMTPISMYISEVPSCRHRAVCIEGSVDAEHVFEMISFIPKAGLNGYYFQFMTPTTFFERWYTHETNPYVNAEKLDENKVRALVKTFEEEIKLRGLLYHAVGHGWTSGPFGFNAAGWHEADDSIIPDEKLEFFAEIDGKRGFYKGVPLNTNMCYSNDKVRDIITDTIVSYCEEHRSVDYLHFWLADSVNSFCECEKCRDTRPSDHYVMMLNEIDEKLSAKNIDTKIVFLIYFDLMWAPEKERIKNPDRFTLMFAPITRFYSQRFKDEYDKPCTTEPFVRNKSQMPNAISKNLSFLKDWFEVAGARDSFDFDYHLMWDHLRDVGYFDVAKGLFEDMQTLPDMGLGGMVSCQLTRAAFPTNLPMQMMADALWDKECDFEEKSDEYFFSAFGDDGLAVKEYMRELSRLFDVNYTRWEKPSESKESAANFTKALGTIQAFESVIERNLEFLPAGNLRRSWEYLDEHSYIAKDIAKALRRRAEGAEEEERIRLFEEIYDKVVQRESKLHRVLDMHQYKSILRSIIVKF